MNEHIHSNDNSTANVSKVVALSGGSSSPMFQKVVKVKSKTVPAHIMKARQGTTAIAALILTYALDAYWVANLMAEPF